MKINMDTSTLDWENINILDSRYIWHLLLMLKERLYQPRLYNV